MSDSQRSLSAQRDPEVLRRTLWGLCEPSLEAIGYQLVELEYARDPRGWILRVYIDHIPTGASQTPSISDADLAELAAGRHYGGSGITHEDCARASRHLGTMLDVEDPIEAAYHLEVSSPGVRRPLRRPEDFQRFAGQLARVELREPHDGRRRFTGILGGLQDGAVLLEVEGRIFALPVDAVRRARLELE